MGRSVFHTELNNVTQSLEYFVMSHVLKWFPEAHYSQVSLPGSNCHPVKCMHPKFVLGTSSIGLRVAFSPALA